MVAIIDEIVDITISTEKRLLDMTWLVPQLKTLWRYDGSPERICNAVASEHSLCFGVYRNASKEAVLEQIGFARVVGDGVSFSSLMDVIIDRQYRRHGLGTMLMEEILGHPDVANTACILGTQFAFNPGAARRFYKKFGFNFCDGVMVRDPK